jgi:hypothetical protein
MIQNTQKTGAEPVVEIKIDGLDWSKWCVSCKWFAMSNQGYVVYAKFINPFFNTDSLTANDFIEEYYKTSRKRPFKVEFRFTWQVSEDDGKMETKVAYLVDVHNKTNSGEQLNGVFELVAIDPPTWYLGDGDGDGSVWTGRVSDVIRQVVLKYTSGIIVDVSETRDNITNKWYMMRMDPKTFISTLLDWSASLTPRKSRWIVNSTDNSIVIKDQTELAAKSKNFGSYIMNSSSGSKNVINWKLLEKNYLSNVQTVLSTSGISAISGLYCDSDNILTKNNVIVYDNKIEKVNPSSIDGYSKPNNLKKGWTHVTSIPEDSAGSVGVNYQNYIDGRIRNIFMGNLGMLQRLMVTVLGASKIHQTDSLGVDVISLQWIGVNGEPYIYNGDWLVYGFEHVFIKQIGSWNTNIYLMRYDKDSLSVIPNA